MTTAPRYSVAFSPSRAAAWISSPLDAAVALYEHLTGPVSTNPHRLGKPLEVSYDGIWTTRRGSTRRRPRWPL